MNIVFQYDVELYQRIEQLIGKQLPLYKTEESEVMVLQERVAEAQRLTKIVRTPVYNHLFCNTWQKLFYSVVSILYFFLIFVLVWLKKSIKIHQKNVHQTPTLPTLHLIVY